MDRQTDGMKEGRRQTDRWNEGSWATDKQTNERKDGQTDGRRDR